MRRHKCKAGSVTTTYFIVTRRSVNLCITCKSCGAQTECYIVMQENRVSSKTDDDAFDHSPIITPCKLSLFESRSQSLCQKGDKMRINFCLENTATGRDGAVLAETRRVLGWSGASMDHKLTNDPSGFGLNLPQPPPPALHTLTLPSTTPTCSPPQHIKQRSYLGELLQSVDPPVHRVRRDPSSPDGSACRCWDGCGRGCHQARRTDLRLSCLILHIEKAVCWFFGWRDRLRKTLRWWDMQISEAISLSEGTVTNKLPNNQELTSSRNLPNFAHFHPVHIEKERAERRKVKKAGCRFKIVDPPETKDSTREKFFASEPTASHAQT
ncbi:hypothetical protein Fcan01_19430 [Folsomia candida]|uniref:Uncharacterized protein n=1 Tax=Folsomia candida TaxID=158441 RepID=A0A226DLR8_FOLCA|nr:hypothetical protein Fcan01_19430 [Folsomia candida]